MKIVSAPLTLLPSSPPGRGYGPDTQTRHGAGFDIAPEGSRLWRRKLYQEPDYLTSEQRSLLIALQSA